MFLQRTLRDRARVEGLGLHTGEPCSLTFVPAPASTGICFARRDIGESIPVRADFVRATANATTLGGASFSVSTVEHCLSVLAACRIDNVLIELDGPEIPIGDGSAAPFMNALRQVGFVEQDQPRQYARIVQTVSVSAEGNKQAYVLPYHGLRISCTIDFPHPLIGQQSCDLDVSESTFGEELAPARTFGFLRDVEALKARGLARGGSLDNCVVLADDHVVNPEGLRFPDEFVRHKALDAVGDLMTLGYPLMGHVVLHRAGHDLLHRLVLKILATPSAFQEMELGARLGRTHRAPLDFVASTQRVLHWRD